MGDTGSGYQLSAKDLAKSHQAGESIRKYVEVDRISASVSVSAPNVDKWALSADIRFWPKAVVSHSVHFRFRRAAVGKFGGCRN